MNLAWASPFNFLDFLYILGFSYSNSQEKTLRYQVMS